MKNKDIRWEQRFSNYKKALNKLEDAVRLSQERSLTDLEKQGLIQGFEYTHELAWKTMKDFLDERGSDKMYGSKDAVREAFRLELISEGEIWMEMILSRNETSHTYNEETANKIADAITDRYLEPMLEFKETMQKLTSGAANE